MLILGICCLSLLIVGLDTTIVNVALPAIRKDMHASVTGLQWTVDAYTLVLAALLMLSASIADRIGRRRVFQIGLVVFSLGSLLCGLAQSVPMLIAFRVVQAIGGSMLNPVAMSIIRTVFDDPRERARAIGIWGAVFGLSMALGPVLGGVLVDSVSWRAVFFVNVPIGAVAIALTALYVPESRAPKPRRLDPVGQLLVIVTLAALTYGIIEGPGAGWGSAQIVGVFAVALVAFVGLIFYELRRREPLIELRFFRSAPFSGASGLAVLVFACIGGFLFLNTLYLQEVRNLSPLNAGLYVLPIAGMQIVAAPLSGRLVASVGARLPLLLGALAVVASALMLTSLEASTSPGLPHRLLRHLRPRCRADQPSDHQHSGSGNAPGSGGRGGGGRIDQPPGGDDARRRRAWRDRRRHALGRAWTLLRHRHPSRVVRDRRTGRGHVRGRGAYDHALGPCHREARPKRAPGRLMLARCPFPFAPRTPRDIDHANFTPPGADRAGWR